MSKSFKELFENNKIDNKFKKAVADNIEKIINDIKNIPNFNKLSKDDILQFIMDDLGEYTSGLQPTNKYTSDWKADDDVYINYLEKIANKIYKKVK